MQTNIQPNKLGYSATKTHMKQTMNKMGASIKNKFSKMTQLNAPTELNILLFISFIFSVFYFFPTHKFVQTTTWFNMGSLVIMSLMGITYAFKNVIKTSTNLSFKTILFYVLIPFASVVVIPIMMNSIHKKYYTYYNESKQRIKNVDTLNTISSFLFMVQLFVLYYLYVDFIHGSHAKLLKPGMLLLLFIINIILVINERVILNSMVTQG